MTQRDGMGREEVSAGALRYRAWAQSWSSAALAARSVLPSNRPATPLFSPACWELGFQAWAQSTCPELSAQGLGPAAESACPVPREQGGRNRPSFRGGSSASLENTQGGGRHAGTQFTSSKALDVADLRGPVYMMGVGLGRPTPEVQREGSTRGVVCRAPRPPSEPQYFTFGMQRTDSCKDPDAGKD